jgi:hypothetical protein
MLRTDHQVEELNENSARALILNASDIGSMAGVLDRGYMNPQHHETHTHWDINRDKVTAEIVSVRPSE